MKRQDGFYFVKFHGNWMIAEWNLECKEWYICGNETSFNDREFDEIGQKIIPSDQKYVCPSCVTKTEEIERLKSENNALTYKINTTINEDCDCYGR